MDESPAPGRVVPRDPSRFARLFPEGRPVMPEDYSAHLDMRPIRVLIGERLRALAGQA